MKDFVTVKNEITSYRFVVEKSTFISFACRASTVGQANFFVSEIAKKHYDATHNCYAYLTEEGQKFSDDGEPQGTAGLPILNAIKSKELFNVAVVVTRYFGGIKLGAGGLVRAYGKAANEVLESAEKATFKECCVFDVNCGYPFVSAVESAAANCKIMDREYADGAKYRIAVPVADEQKFIKALNNAAQGKAKFEKICLQMTEF